MQYIILIALGIPTILVCRHITRLRRTGRLHAAKHLYRRAAWAIGMASWLCMLTQEAVLWQSGMLSWQTGLPLHLCSFTGVITLPMLLTESRSLRHFTLCLGMPGALAALLFPAVLDTPWPMITKISFFGLHAAIALSPLLPLSMGRFPEPRGVVQAAGILALLALIAALTNAVSGSNYLFLRSPVAGTPLMLLARAGNAWYRMALAALCAAWLAIQYAAVRNMVCKVRVKSL